MSGLRVAILCPGPSLREAWPPADRYYGEVIAVNRAILVGGRWLVALDSATMAELAEPAWRERAAIVATRIELDQAARREDVLWGLPRLQVEHLEQRLGWPAQCEWKVFSMTVAIALAVHLGAGEIDLYGADLAGIVDFDGHTCDRNRRGQDRWAREARILDALRDRCDAAGVELTRILPQPETRPHG